MRAFAVDEFGGAGSIHDLDVPEPDEGQVRVRVAAAGVNPADVFMLKGFYKDRLEHRFPLVPGADVAGTVDAVGDAAGQWKVGDEVFGGLGKMVVGAGSMAEYTTASTKTIAMRPAGIDAHFGAALPLPGVSALMCIDPMGLKKGDVVIILGAAGGIGGFALQLAKAAGAHVVAVTREVNAAYVRGLGADEVVDYSKGDIRQGIHSAHPDGVAGIVHAGGEKDELAKLADLVRKGGHVVSMRGGADVEQLAKRDVTGLNVMTMVTTESLERLAGLVSKGTIKRPEIKTFSLDQAGEAYKEIAEGHVRGKLIVAS
ncbi:MAG TPA: NADP-dependent oxidoreductase [Candidatus Dormibacteraeota bacterium]